VLAETFRRPVMKKMVFVVVLMFLAFLATSSLPPTADADDPNICISLSPTAVGLPIPGIPLGPIVGAPVVILDVIASYKAPTVYELHGTASSTQATFPPTEVFYLVSGTAYVTTKSAVEFSLTGTAEDATCECIKEVVFHVIYDGMNNRYKQIIRNAKAGSTDILTGTAQVSQDCGKKK
jgi:hypothetical protein